MVKFSTQKLYQDEIDARCRINSLISPSIARYSVISQHRQNTAKKLANISVHSIEEDIEIIERYLAEK